MTSRWRWAFAAAVAAALCWRVVSALGSWPFVAAEVVAACMAVAITARLATALRSAEQNVAELMDAYMQAQRNAEQIESTYQERLHDARSAAASVRGAVTALGDRANARAGESAQLRWVLAAELDRMQALLQGRTGETTQDFDLAQVLEPVVQAHRIDGARIDSALQSALVRGLPSATASVLDNLVRNARTHAPGARIWVRSLVEGEFAAVIVDDDGPGIPAAEWEKVLLAGFRGSDVSAPGNGLGLHIAAAAIAQQSGSLRVARSNTGGARVVFALPLAVAQQVPAGGVGRLAS